jgi:hypothetical protein
MLWLVLFLPLLVCWRLERHLKSKMMAACASVAAQQRQQGVSSSGDREAGSSLFNSSSTRPTRHGAIKHLEGFYTAPVTLPFFPNWPQLCKVLVVSLMACFVAGELFVWLCVLWPGLAGILREPVLI